MLGRSRLVQVHPFRWGLASMALGVFLLLSDSGGYVGTALDEVVGTLIGRTGTLIAGSALALAGVLLLSGASVGALVQRSHGAVRRAHTAARRRVDRRSVLEDRPLAPAIPLRPRDDHPPVDAVSDFPDVVGQSEPPPLLHSMDEPTETSEQQILFEPPAPAKADYVLPEPSLLKRAPARSSGKSDNGKVAESLTRALADFGVDARVVGEITGPRVTRYELQLAAGTKMSKISALKDDLSYALATTEIRILAPIPGKQAVGVEVPNLSPNLVTLGDVFDQLPATASPLSVWLGKDISGNAVWTDLARMPHLLIAGTTGAGKSGCINTILTSVLLRATPDDARLILIDPKRIELSLYESIPHLLTPVVSSPKEASIVLTNVLAEMERRYERLATVRARNLPEANRAFRQRGEETLPYLLVVIDELADLMMISPQQVEDAVIRLAQKSRAVGIHLVLATQRPSVDVITGMIKANVPSRIAFAVSSQTDSRVILDQAGAEPPRAGRHALQAARDVTAPARAGRLRDRGGDRAPRRAVPDAARPGAGRVAARGARGASGRARRRRRGLRPRPGPAARPGDRHRRPDTDGFGVAPPTPATGRLHPGGTPHRHAGAPRDHLRLRRLQAETRACGGKRAGARPFLTESPWKSTNLPLTSTSKSKAGRGLSLNLH